jgi:hypothetical protein
MGHIIPAGTGYSYHRKVEIKALVEPLPVEEVAVPADQPLAG